MQSTKFFSAIVLSALCACSTAVQSTYLRTGYDSKAEQAIKRIAVVAWADNEAHEGLDTLLAQAATDRISLKMSYLVYKTEGMKRGWSDACGEKEQGVLSIRALEVLKVAGQPDMSLSLVAELHDCRTGALVWRAVGSDATPSKDDDLEKLRENYVSQFGEAVGPFAAPAFLIVRDMLDALPDVTLNDDEIMEKIELGSAPRPHLALNFFPLR